MIAVLVRCDCGVGRRLRVLRWWRRFGLAVGVALAVLLLPSTAWAEGGTLPTSAPNFPTVAGYVVPMGTPPAEGQTTWVENGWAELDQAQMLAYSTPPVPMELDADQFAAFMIGVSVLIGLSAAGLILGMRR